MEHKRDMEKHGKRSKRMGKENNKGYHVHKGLKMLNSTFDAEEIFEDWNWNLLEEERLEDIFSEWLWNLEPQVKHIGMLSIFFIMTVQRWI